MTILGKKQMSEEDIKLNYITPAILIGWKGHITMETKITDGRINISGNIVARSKAKFADYLLYLNDGKPIAVVEAKDNNHSVSHGLQQAMTYAQMMDLPFAYSSNGDAFYEHDFLTGQEQQIALDDFPTQEELVARYYAETNDGEGISDTEKKIVLQPYYSSQSTYPPRYYQRNAVNRTVEAIARGQQRLLLVMATGTGKTYTAFQIVYRLLRSDLKKRILYLADRNILVDQSILQDFVPLEKTIYKVDFSDKECLNKIAAHEVNFALYHQMVGQNDEELYQQIQAEKQRLIKEGKIKKEKPLPEIAKDEILFDIPNSWKWCYVGDLFLHNTGKAQNSSSSANGTIRRFITTSNLYWGEFDFTKVKEMPFTAAELERCTVKKGDLLVCEGGDCGRSAVWNYDEEVCIQNHVHRLRPYRDVNIYYFYYLFYLYKNTGRLRGRGVAIQGLSSEAIHKVILPLPPLKEQHRIVAKIEELLPYVDRYAVAYEKLEQFNAKFPEDMKKSILQYAIQGKLVEQRQEEGTGEELYQQIQAEKQRLIKEGKIRKEKSLPEIAEEEIPFDIPESWTWVSVGNVCVNIQYGSSQKSVTTGKIAVLRMGNIQNGRLVFDKLVYTSDDKEIEKYPLQYNDLLFNRTNSKELVGKTAIYKGEIPAIYAGYLVRITPLFVDSDYLNFVMQSQFYWSYCQTVRSDAIGQSNINAEKLKRFMFPLPPLAEQKRIVAKLEEILPLCERLK